MPLPSNPADQPPASPGAGATVDQWLTYLEAIHPTEIDLGLDRVLVAVEETSGQRGRWEWTQPPE